MDFLVVWMSKPGVSGRSPVVGGSYVLLSLIALYDHFLGCPTWDLWTFPFSYGLWEMRS